MTEGAQLGQPEVRRSGVVHPTLLNRGVATKVESLSTIQVVLVLGEKISVDVRTRARIRPNPFLPERLSEQSRNSFQVGACISQISGDFGPIELADQIDRSDSNRFIRTQHRSVTRLHRVRENT